MDVGGMFRLFDHALGSNHDALFYAHSKSDIEWRQGMLFALTRYANPVIQALTKDRSEIRSQKVGMVGAYCYPFDYFNLRPFLELMAHLEVPLNTSWDRYYKRYPFAKFLSWEHRLAHAREINQPTLRPEVDLEYAKCTFGDYTNERQPMNAGLLPKMISDGVLGPLPYFPGNFFWVSMHVVRELRQKIDFNKEFELLTLNLKSDRELQSRSHAWERALPVFAAKNGFKLVSLKNGLL